MTQPRSQMGMLTTLVVTLSLIAFGVPNRLVSQWTFAAEQGRIAAARVELSKADVTANSFRLVAAAVRPSVVQISVTVGREALTELRALNERRAELLRELDEIQRAGELDSDNPRVMGLRKQLGELESEREELAERLHDGTGSGVVLDDKGHILTNNHVVGGRGKITIRTIEDREYAAEVVGTDPKTDLAVIKVSGVELHPLPLGDSDEMQVGDWVLAIGAPFGLSQTVTHGIISAKGRTDIATRSTILYQDFLQTDAAINPGNSGGPLLNLRGEVIGINTAIATNESQSNAGVAFTIPSNMARQVAKQLIESGSVARGWLGISLSEVTDADAEILGVRSGQGVLIEELYEDTAAFKAGLLPDDLILSINDDPATNIRRVQGIVANITPGETARVKVLRDGNEMELRFAVDRQPDDIQAYVLASGNSTIVSREVSKLPIRVRTLLPRSRNTEFERWHLRAERRGVIVESLREVRGEPEYNIGRGDLIVAINDKPVQTVGELVKLISEGRSTNGAIKLSLVGVDGSERSVKLKP